MEIVTDKTYWLNPNHPNYERWKRSREISIERGKFVELVLSNEIKCENLNILDLGSGEGGTSKVFSKKNNVISYDISKTRLLRQQYPDIKLNYICGSASFLPFHEKLFDLIILQDVLEHLDEREELVGNLFNLLNENGIIYLSTPNRLSLLNIIADPHWGVSLISLLKRESIKKYFLKTFRKSEQNRKDIAELLSLNSVLRLLEKKFEILLFTKTAVNELFKGNKGIAWSKFHLNIIKFSNWIRFNKIIVKLTNNKVGFLNKYLTPTFYFILKKKSN